MNKVDKYFIIDFLKLARNTIEQDCKYNKSYKITNMLFEFITNLRYNKVISFDMENYVLAHLWYYLHLYDYRKDH